MKGCLIVTMLATAKEDWIEKYALKILGMWQVNHTPLGGVDDGYIAKLREDLAGYFDDPLKKSLIETSY